MTYQYPHSAAVTIAIEMSRIDGQTYGPSLAPSHDRAYATTWHRRG